MNNQALTHNDLDAYIASYRDGLIDGHELVCITKACVRERAHARLDRRLSKPRKLSTLHSHQRASRRLSRASKARGKSPKKC